MFIKDKQNISGFNNRDAINLCIVKMKNKWALMNENCKILTDYLFDNVLCFAHGLAGVKKMINGVILIILAIFIFQLFLMRFKIIMNIKQMSN